MGSVDATGGQHERHGHVIVPVYLGKEETLRCLRSLERLEDACRVVVVDNGSGDGSAEYIARHAPGSELIELPANVRFGAACNHAIRRALQEAACECVFLLNNDASLHPRALAADIRREGTRCRTGRHRRRHQ